MSVNISVRSKRFNADITLNEKVTFICGDSGVGKTQFTKCVAKDITGVSVTVSNGFDCTVLANSRFEDYVNTAKKRGISFYQYIKENGVPFNNSIVVVDSEDFILSREFASLVSLDKVNYYILISRAQPKHLGYSFGQVYDFVGDGSRHFLRLRNDADVYVKSVLLNH